MNDAQKVADNAVAFLSTVRSTQVSGLGEQVVELCAVVHQQIDQIAELQKRVEDLDAQVKSLSVHVAPIGHGGDFK